MIIESRIDHIGDNIKVSGNSVEFVLKNTRGDGWDDSPDEFKLGCSVDDLRNILGALAKNVPQLLDPEKEVELDPSIATFVNYYKAALNQPFNTSSKMGCNKEEP
jgi:hypothetical protein